MVYKLEYIDDVMKIIIISARTDEAVYKEAAKRQEKNKFLMYSQVELHTHFRMYPDLHPHLSHPW